MEEETRRQLRGLTDLVTKAVAGTVAGIEPVHREIAHYPYAVLTQIPGIRAPARAIERLQLAITTGSYATVRGINRLVGVTAMSLLRSKRDA